MFKYLLLASIMLYGPYAWCWLRGESPESYGLIWRMDSSDIKLVVLATAATLLPLTLVAMNWPGQSLPRALPAKTVLHYLAAGFIAAVVEETFFRGWIQSLFRKRFSPAFSIVAVSLIFALSHLFMISHWLRLATFFPGLVMGYLREKNGNVLGAIIYHGIGNLWAIWFFPGL